MYAFGVLMLRLATNLPAMSGAFTSRPLPLTAHVRVNLLGEVWDDNRGILRPAANGCAALRPDHATPEGWAALPGADTRAWEGPMLARFGALALRCTEAERNARPPMADVAARLESLLARCISGDLIPEPLMSRGGECWICMEAPRDTEFLPCCHMISCGPCAQGHLLNSTRCPFCDGEAVMAVPANRTASSEPSETPSLGPPHAEPAAVPPSAAAAALVEDMAGLSRRSGAPDPAQLAEAVRYARPLLGSQMLRDVRQRSPQEDSELEVGTLPAKLSAPLKAFWRDHFGSREASAPWAIFIGAVEAAMPGELAKWDALLRAKHGQLVGAVMQAAGMMPGAVLATAGAFAHLVLRRQLGANADGLVTPSALLQLQVP